MGYKQPKSDPRDLKEIIKKGEGVFERIKDKIGLAYCSYIAINIDSDVGEEEYMLADDFLDLLKKGPPKGKKEEGRTFVIFQILRDMPLHQLR